MLHGISSKGTPVDFSVVVPTNEIVSPRLVRSEVRCR